MLRRPSKSKILRGSLSLNVLTVLVGMSALWIGWNRALVHREWLRERHCRTNLTRIGSALKSFRADHGYHPDELASLVGPKLVGQSLVCPTFPYSEVVSSYGYADSARLKSLRKDPTAKLQGPPPSVLVYCSIHTGDPHSLSKRVLVLDRDWKVRYD
jgi:hypothetical protein